jgi:hypothetical protein
MVRLVLSPGKREVALQPLVAGSNTVFRSHTCESGLE